MKNITKKIRKPNTVLFAVLLTQPVNFSLANLFEKKYPNQMMGHYEIEKQENPDVIRMRLLTENNQKTNIFFDLMKENGLPWDSTLVDNEFEIAVPARIFRTPYFAHLEHYKSLESQFYRLMRPLFDVNKNAQFPKAVIWDSSNNPQFPGIDDSLDAFIKSITSEKKELTPGKDAALHFSKKVEQLVAKSRSQLSAKITKAKTEDQKNLLNWLAKSSLAKLVDKTEAIYVTDEEKKSKKLLHDFSQISAFNLSPLKILLKWPDQTFRALIAAAEQDTFNPLLWLYANDGHDKKIKLHLMKLLTHNHRAEGLFIQMLYLTSNESNIRDRVIKCYEAYAAINRLCLLYTSPSPRD